MVLVGAAILPHGQIAFDGEKSSDNPRCVERRQTHDKVFQEKAERMYDACCGVGQWVASLCPDIIVIDTPHGIAPTDGAMAVYINPTATGTAALNTTWEEYKVSVDVELEVSNGLITHLTQDGVAAIGITCFLPQYSVPLAWGEVVPLWYCQKYLQPGVKYVFISHNMTPPEVGDDTERRLAVGQSLATYFSALKQRVVYITGGDLGHAYTTDCTNPLYLLETQYKKEKCLVGNHELCKQFEEEVLSWIQSQMDSQSESSIGAMVQWDPEKAFPWLNKLISTNTMTFTCVCHSLVTLHGVLDHMHHSGSHVTSQLFGLEVPSYYGMITCTFGLD